MRASLGNIAFAGALLLAPIGAPAQQQETDTAKVIEGIQSAVESIWGLPLGGPVAVNTKSREELGEYIAAESARPENARKVEARLLMLVALDLIPPDTPITSIGADFYRNNLGGFYDPRDKALHLIGGFDAASPASQRVLAHEITHALQDRKYDLVSLVEEAASSDAILARRAVVEGDASYTENLWAAQGAGTEFDSKAFFARWESSVAGTPALQQYPAFLVQDALFPYIKGGRFLAVGAKGDYATARTRAFSDPPKSTEQVLHPLKYWGARRDEPLTVDLAKFPPQWQDGVRDVMGQWSLAQFLCPQIDAPTTLRVSMDTTVTDKIAAEAAKGWGGDALAFATNGDDFAFVLATVWDTATDAREFEAALRRRVGLFPGFKGYDPAEKAREAAMGGEPVEWRFGGRIARFQRTRIGVTFVLATSDEALAAGIAVLPRD